MTLAAVRRRFRPLLRMNDWATQELAQQIETQRDLVRGLDARLSAAQQELGNWRAVQQRSLEGAGGVDRGGFALAAQQTGDWLRVAREIDARRRQEAQRLQELQGRLLELKRKRQVIQRRQDEVLRENTQMLESRLQSAQDDLWLSRRSA